MSASELNENLFSFKRRTVEDGGFGIQTEKQDKIGIFQQIRFREITDCELKGRTTNVAYAGA